jgi:NAD(P)-dependent dehydrogenase (short-subunit alcohol dehydrogenase family)
MRLDLEDKVALITGGSKGIGLACAQALLAEGTRVAICSRSSENIERARRILPGAFAVTADLSDATSALRMVETVESALGPVDILVNSAGAARRQPPDELDPAAWRQAMDAKFFPTINVADPMVKRMAARGHGVIVNIIGTGGKLAGNLHLAGGAANAALMLATTGLGHAYAGRGVRVVGLSPGLVETDRIAERIDTLAETEGITLVKARARIVGNIPMGRLAKPEEIARAVVFLASSAASFVTGSILTVDGGELPVI